MTRRWIACCLLAPLLWASSAIAQPTREPPGAIAPEISQQTPRPPDADLPLSDALERLAPSPMPEPVRREEASTVALTRYASAYARYLEGNLSGARSDAIDVLKIDPRSFESLTLLARIEGRLGRPLRAAYFYERALEINPLDPESVIELSESALTLGDPERALTLCTRLMTPDSIDARPWLRPILMHHAARALGAMGYVDAAVEAAAQLDLPVSGVVPGWASEAVLDALRSRATLWLSLGDRAIEFGRPELALSLFDRAEEAAESRVPLVMTHRAYALIEAGRVREAEAMVIQRIESAGAADAECRALVRYIAGQGGSRERLAGAISGIARAVEARDRASAASLNRLAATTQSAERGIAVLSRHLEANPTDASAAGQLLSLIAESRGADAAWREAVALSSADPWQAEDIADGVYAAIDDRGALTRLSEDETSAASTLLSGLVQWRLGRERNATRFLEAVALDPALDGAAVAPAARLKFMLGRLDEALEIIERADESASIGVRRGKAAALEALTLHEDARRVLEPALAGDVDARTAYTAGVVLRELGRWQEAASMFERAWRLDPLMHRAAAAVLRIVAPGGTRPDESRAVAIAREIREADPASPVLGWLRVQSQLASGQPDLAIQELRLLHEEHPGEEAFVLALAEVLLASDRADEAERWLSSVIESNPGDSAARMALARVRIATARYDDTADMLEDWLKRFPGDYEASKVLEQVYTDFLSLRITAEDLARKRIAMMPRTVDTVVEDLAISVSRKQFDRVRQLLDELDALSPARSPELGARLNDIAQEALVRASLSEALIDDAIDIVHEIRDRYMLANNADLLELELAMWARSTAETGALIRAADRAEQSRLLEPGRATQMLSEMVRTPNRPIRDRAEFQSRQATSLALLRHGATEGPTPTIELATLWFYRALFQSDYAEVGDALEYIERRGWRTSVMRHLVGAGLVPPVAGDWHGAMWQTVAAMGAIGREAAADVAYECVLFFDPDDPGACNDLGYRLLERGEQIPRAVALIEKAYMANPRDAATVDSMGWARYVQGRLADETDPETGAVTPGAVTLLERSLELLGPAPQPGVNTVFGWQANTIITKDHLGDAYWANGDRERAERMWAESAELADAFLDGLAIEDQSFGSEIASTRDRSLEKIEAARAGHEPPVADMIGLGADPATIPARTGEEASGVNGEQGSGRS